MIPLHDAQRIVARIVLPAARTERIALEAALGRVLAEAPASDSDLPPFDRATMDGFAIRCDAEGDAPWRIAGTLAAGATAQRPLAAREALRIMTGAPVPADADAVVPIELAEVGADGATVRFTRPPKPGQNVHPRASDLKAGERPLAAGVRVTPPRVALLATLGRRQVEVGRRPRVAILTTGDELVSPDVAPRGGQIRDSNRFALAVQVASAGGEALLQPPVGDDPGRIRAALATAADPKTGADVLLVTGGSSVGDFDFSREVVAGLGGRLWFDQVAIKPGKPVLLFTLGARVVFCLPGNPASSFVTFELFVRPLLERLAGATQVWPTPIESPASAPLQAPPERDLLALASFTAPEGGGKSETAPVRWSGSGDLVAIARANALVHLRKGRAAARGEPLRVLLFRSSFDDLPRSAEPIE
ncbi:MAG TPA: gephyrin-like molybdotransferase Glp [Planctomycetota bacterium]|nr:gephyrin-like molybdotransferase Glp [Planctomycetota bacterium]